ncbi:site-specific integrase [Methylocystis sp. B8]|uniref:tyrosine-type recombinase/integrase n=1 Tax=Methylocystis sp. B8 TaxID=544938 RepID=UPI0010FF5DD7|nr:site-specific integrase [Methylocystis sp. B8]TLG75151.1 DUF4102 domain-containing protein [Methylocystis sp. B8]
MSSHVKVRLTKQFCDTWRPSKDDDVAWDEATECFGLRAIRKGEGFRKTFVVQKKGAGKKTIGPYGLLTLDQGRKAARELLARLALGENPIADERKRRDALTVAELCEQYLDAARAGLVVTNKKRVKAESTVSIDEGRVARHIIPLLGKLPANSLAGRADLLQRFYDDVAAGKTAGKIKTKTRGMARVQGGAPAAKRAVGLFGGIWTWASKRGLVEGANPTRGVDMAADATRERILAAHELANLGQAMRGAAERETMAAAAVRILALTGMRREEAVSLRWREIDAATQCLRLEATKTGRSMRPIGRAALDYLQTLPRLHDEFVFPNRDGTGAADLKKQIAAIFDDAKLTDARSQTLRRTFASIAADEGYGDATIAELLGHSRRGVTQRSYIRRPDAALVAAADRVAARIAAAMDGQGADVVSLPTRAKAHRNEQEL